MGLVYAVRQAAMVSRHLEMSVGSLGLIFRKIPLIAPSLPPFVAENTKETKKLRCYSPSLFYEVVMPGQSDPKPSPAIWPDLELGLRMNAAFRLFYAGTSRKKPLGGRKLLAKARGRSAMWDLSLRRSCMYIHPNSKPRDP